MNMKCMILDTFLSFSWNSISHISFLFGGVDKSTLFGVYLFLKSIYSPYQWITGKLSNTIQVNHAVFVSI